jgi:hypothetical protein
MAMGLRGCYLQNITVKVAEGYARYIYLAYPSSKKDKLRPAQRSAQYYIIVDISYCYGYSYNGKKSGKNNGKNNGSTDKRYSRYGAHAPGGGEP